jgi:hypothetical protein
LAEDYEALATVFQDVGFVGTPLQWRPDETFAFEERPIGEFSVELRKAMRSNADGTSRFGALAEVGRGTISRLALIPAYRLSLLLLFIFLYSPPPRISLVLPCAFCS